MLNRIVIFCLLFSASWVSAQPTITLDDIHTLGTFRMSGVPGFNFLNDGRHYTRLLGNSIIKYDLSTGLPTDTILDTYFLTLPTESRDVSHYTFSDDEKKVMLSSNIESVYRHSTKENNFVYDFQTQTLAPVSGLDKQMHATFSPDGKHVAYVQNNNLYVLDLTNFDPYQITKDGKWNEVINGSCDWVYEEEFSFTKAFEWSPDNRYIAYYRFDERDVPMFSMTQFTDSLYPIQTTFKYPKVGMKNAVVSIYIFDTQTKQSKLVDRTSEVDGYIPRIKWTNDPGKLCMFWMNRHQNHLELLLADATTGKTQLLLKEENKYYIDIHDNLTFLNNGKGFLWTSEMDGYNHIYHYDMKGNLVRQITKGPWEVTSFYGYDEKDNMVYYQANKKNAMEREIYKSTLDGKHNSAIADADGTNMASFSTTFDMYVLTHSTINTPPSIRVMDRKGKEVRVLEENNKAKEKQTTYQARPVEFFEFTTSENVKLNGFMVKPYNFDPNKKYPVYMTMYGGPGSQEVIDRWDGDYWWYQCLAQQGYVVACVDNRGTGGRGEEFKKMTYLNLGHYETLDQIEAAKYLGRQSFVDPERISMFGWSYGGYMSSLCILKGADVFNSAIAVAPVTNWKYYDSIYTERYMRTTAENQEGYEQNSPVNFVDNLTGNYLLIHGDADDNVHFQNSAMMAEALIKANKQFDTYIYPNRNHGIYGDNARRHLFTKVNSFINENLKPENPLKFSNSKPKS